MDIINETNLTTYASKVAVSLAFGAGYYIFNKISSIGKSLIKSNYNNSKVNSNEKNNNYDQQSDSTWKDIKSNKELIDLLEKNSIIETPIKILEKCFNYGVTADISLYNTLLNYCLRNNYYNEFDYISKELNDEFNPVPVNEEFFKILFKGLNQKYIAIHNNNELKQKFIEAQNLSFEECFDLELSLILEQLEKNNFLIDIDIQNIILESLIKLERYEDALEQINELISTPNEKSFEIILNFFTIKFSYEQIIKLDLNKRKEEILCSLSLSKTFSRLANNPAIIKSFIEVVLESIEIRKINTYYEILDKLESLTLKSNLELILPIVHYYCSKKNTDKLFSISENILNMITQDLTKVCELSGFFQVTYLLIKYYLEVQNLKYAEELFFKVNDLIIIFSNEIESDKLTHHIGNLYSLMLKAYLSNNQYDKLSIILDEVLKSDLSQFVELEIFNKMLDYYYESNQIVKFEKLIEKVYNSHLLTPEYQDTNLDSFKQIKAELVLKSTKLFLKLNRKKDLLKCLSQLIEIDLNLYLDIEIELLDPCNLYSQNQTIVNNNILKNEDVNNNNNYHFENRFLQIIAKLIIKTKRKDLDSEINNIIKFLKLIYDNYSNECKNNKETMSLLIMFFSVIDEPSISIKLFDDCIRQNFLLDYAVYEYLIQAQIRSKFYERGISLIKYIMNKQLLIKTDLLEGIVKICLKTNREKEASEILTYGLDIDLQLDLDLIERITYSLAENEKLKNTKTTLYISIINYYKRNGIYTSPRLMSTLCQTAKTKLNLGVKPFIPSNREKEVLLNTNSSQINKAEIFSQNKNININNTITENKVSLYSLALENNNALNKDPIISFKENNTGISDLHNKTNYKRKEDADLESNTEKKFNCNKFNSFNNPAIKKSSEYYNEVSYNSNQNYYGSKPLKYTKENAENYYKNSHNNNKYFKTNNYIKNETMQYKSIYQ